MAKRDLRIWLTIATNTAHIVVRWIDPQTGKRYQKSTGTKNKKEAERFLGKLEAELVEQRYRADRRVPWAMFRDRYETEHLSGLRDRTFHKACTVFDAVEELLKPQFVNDLTADSLSRLRVLLRERDGKPSETTIDGYLRHLRAALGWAVDMNMIRERPRIRMQRRVTSSVMRGRPITEEELERMKAKVPSVVGDDAAESWQQYIEGLWWSGLRLTESLTLSWDDRTMLCVNLSHRRPMLSIPNELEKGKKDRLLPMAPEFAEFLLKTPADQRSGPVFRPRGKRRGSIVVGPDYAMHVISRVGEEAKVKVNNRGAGAKPKYASAHDLRRAFGERWASRVMPPVLMELMRHESITTTLKYYVGRNAERTADQAWEAYRQHTTSTTKPETKTGDTLGDTPTPESEDAKL